MPRLYTAVRIYGYNDTGALQDKIAEFIQNAQDRDHYAEIQYSISNSMASALCMEYVEDK